MSGYRNYAPWKSTLPYKSGSSSTYSSRDDVNASDSKSRFGLLGSPAAFRPSYSGGTYRSIKRDAPLVVPLPKNYGSNYGSASKDEKVGPKTTPSSLQTPAKSSLQPTQQKYTGNASRNLSKYGRKSRDPSPTLDRRPTLTVTRAKSRDPSPIGDRRHNSGAYSTSTSNLTKFGHRSRDPSPATSELRLNTGLQGRSLRSMSRDPSPVNVQYKTSLGTSQNNYGSNYRLGQRGTKNYGSKYASNTSSSSSSNAVPDKALSYMSISDFRARSVSRTHDCTKKLEKLSLNDEKSDRDVSLETSDSGAKVQDDKQDSEEDEEEYLEPEVFVSVTVVTRGTSPNPPGSSIVRTRRLELAKTIEKTIQRSTRKPKCFDKEIQSDRLDDTTRYSRFSSASRLSTTPWSSPYSSESKFSRSDSSKYTTNVSSGSCSSSKLVKSDSDSDKKKKDESSISRNNSSSSRSSMKQDKSKSSPESKLSKASSKHSSSSAKHRSSDNLVTASSRSLPPAIPKADSPTKSASTSSGSSRWPNKDFRKSALNVGPTDRPRKSRTPSTGTDTDEKCEQQKSSPAFSRTERSPSVGSEASSSTSSSGNSSADDTKHDHQGQVATTSLDNDFDQTRENACFTPEQVPKDSNYVESYNKSFDSRGDREPADHPSEENDVQNFHQIRSPNICPATGADSSEQLVARTEDAKSILIRKLGSISNFFTTRNLDDSSGEGIYLDSSSGGSGVDASISGVLKEDAPTTTASVSQLQVQTQSQVLNPTVAVTSNTNSDLDESSWWQNTSQQIDTESALDLRDDMKYKLRHIDSGEVAWWMRNDNDRGLGDNEDDTIADDLKTLNQQNDFDTDPDRSDRTDRFYTNETKRSVSRDRTPWWPTSTSESSLKEKSPRIRRIESGERAWWLNDSNEGNPNSVETSQYDDSCYNNANQYQNQKLGTLNESPVNQSYTNGSSNEATSPGGSYYSGRTPYPHQKLSTVNENVVSQFERSSPHVEKSGSQYKIPWWMADTSQESDKKGSMFKIRHNESGERAWWLSDANDSQSRNASSSSQPETYQPPKMNTIRRVESGEVAWWLQDDTTEPQQKPAAPEDDEVKRATANYYKYNPSSDPLYDSSYGQIPPLGDRRSPEGLEDTSQARKSPHHNNKNMNGNNYINTSNGNNNCDSEIPTVTVKIRSGKAASASEKLFISRHTNIDELLGGSCRPLSPLLNRFNAGNTGGKTDLGFFYEEISPQQVRIHDSTAQMPVIQRMERDEWDYASGNQQQKYKLDDAAIQVYKDGDYGAYLDLESSLAEQAEEIEGLDSR
ncbi:unnamed protein product [Hermetia illucens]|uniref:FHOD1 N-terminal GTPase-binding domain-containing protein n=1 Tax=Hermetia illucens TaxID=343691 RepID=A0A7R8UL25_HERIL|nr:unnamed protein product [Hermetia illucens]